MNQIIINENNSNKISKYKLALALSNASIIFIATAKSTVKRHSKSKS